MPLLSIIVPTFNSDLTIERCLKSIYEQIFHDFELLIVDGGSTDKTLEIVTKFADQGKNIRVISEKDNGTYDAMNKGIHIAAGSWIYFLGSDDWFYNNQVLYDVFSMPHELKYDVMYGDVYRTGLRLIYDGAFTDEKLLQKNISHQAIFYKKTIFDITGVYNIKYKILSDWDHNFKWFYHPSISKKYIDLVIANFTDHGVSGYGEDEVFQSEKFLNLYRYSYNYLSKDMKLGVIKLIIYSFRVRKKYARAAGFMASFIGTRMKSVFKRKLVTF